MIKLIIEDYLEEGSYVSFGGQANPPYGWAVCLAGGPGSGKGFVQDKFFLLDFKSFDVDELKSIPQYNTKWRIMEENLKQLKVLLG